jgi:hypothetical protein
MKGFLIVISFFLFGVLHGQEFTFSGYVYDADQTGVANIPVELHTRSISSYEINEPSYSNYNFTGGLSLTGCDDCVQGPYNIGFTFNYFGNNYTQFYVSSNGWIGFSAGQTNGYTAQFLPNGGAPKNAILADWEDLLPNTGNMNYYTTGTAPNRVLVFNFNNVPHYGCRSNLHTFQIVLFETTNVIDVNFQSKPLCGGNGATLGLTNIDGGKVVPVGGKNASVWSILTPQKYRFSPSVVSNEFVLNRSVMTNSQGRYQFLTTGLDVNNFEFRVKFTAPIPTQQFTNNDGKRISDIVFGLVGTNGLTYHRFDLNNDGRINVSDQYLLFGLKSGSIAAWVVPRSSVFTPNEFTSITNSITNSRSLYPGSSFIMTGNLTRGGSQNFYIITPGYSGKVNF